LSDIDIDDDMVSGWMDADKGQCSVMAS